MKITKLIKSGQYDATLELIKVTNLSNTDNLEILNALSTADDHYINIFIIEKPLINPIISSPFWHAFWNALKNKKLIIYNYLKKYMTDENVANIICMHLTSMKHFNELETNIEYKRMIFNLLLQQYPGYQPVVDILNSLN